MLLLLSVKADIQFTVLGTEGGRLSRPRQCSKRAQLVCKVVLSRDKQLPVSFHTTVCMLPLDHRDLQRHVGVNNLPKVVTRQWWPAIELAIVQLQIQHPNHFTTEKLRACILITWYQKLPNQARNGTHIR